jgi:hypothetical protein
MRRIENMKTMSVHREALDRTARHIVAIRPELRLVPAASTGAALELQLDEIQHTFSARGEW